ncbi:MAG: hypothetical protein QW632_03310 [Ignisphaera sp.]
MPKSKEKSMCIPTNDSVINAVLECIEKDCGCIALYLDYNEIRYPVLSIYGYIVPCDSMPPALEELVGDIFLELVTTIDSVTNIGNVGSNLMDNVIMLMTRCSSGWIRYGYASTRSAQTVPNVSKAWLYISDDGEQKILSQVEEFASVFLKLIRFVFKKVREILENER